MGVYTYRAHHEWTPVEPKRVRRIEKCNRCGNTVQYFLAYDGDAWGFPGLWTKKLKQKYAWVCPVCPNFSELSKSEAKIIIEG